jgi:hypothetical protein
MIFVERVEAAAVEHELERPTRRRLVQEVDCLTLQLPYRCGVDSLTDQGASGVDDEAALRHYASHARGEITARCDVNRRAISDRGDPRYHAGMPHPSWNDSYASGEPLPWDTGGFTAAAD